MSIIARNLRPGALLDFSIDATINTVMNKAAGDSTGGALAKGVGEAALWSLIMTPKAGWVYSLGQIGVAGVSAAHQAIRRNWHEKRDRYYTSGEIGGGYVDTRQALTMRQAAVHAIRESRINGRLVLGNEASYMHR